MDGVQISILGPVEVSNDGVAIAVAGARVRALLVRLALGYGRTVSANELIDTIWSENPPADAANALQSLVSRLRRTLGSAGSVLQVPGGYRLDVSSDDVDARRFIVAARAGRASLRSGSFEAAAGTLRSALAMWRGPALVDLDPLPPAADELAELRLGALEDRVEADIEGGRALDVVGELEALAAANPLRERLTGLLMSALAHSGRPAEALSAYERVRRYLADELGSDPSAELQQAHLELLRGQARPEAQRPRHRTNLRAQRTTFLGRADEAKRIAGLLESSRLVSIIGPGGSGKTRLAGVVAGEFVDAMDDGVWLVELAPVTDPANVAPAVLSSLGLRANKILERNQDRVAANASDRLLDLLADAECLLVIDNCEHLITAVAELADLLIAHSPSLRILTTSREPLGIDGEALCLLPPLLLPPVDASAVDALDWPSVQLFSDRAAAVSADFSINDQTVGAVVEIVRRLDGLPLAIELAAARLRVMPVGEIANRISDRFRLLTGGSRAAMPRHRTLRAVVEWSWELMTPAEQRLAERLAIFPSGATVESATAVCANTYQPGEHIAADGLLTAEDIPELLSTLVDKSLLQVTDANGLRYRMLETIREYGAEQLADRGEIMAVRQAHAQYFSDLVHEADRWLRRAEQVPWLRRLESERDNILAALRFLGESGDSWATIELALKLGMHWTLLNSHAEAASWLRFALEVEGPSDLRHRTMAEGLVALNSLVMTFGEGDTDVVQSRMTDLEAIGDRLDELDATDEPFLIMIRPMLAFFTNNRPRMYHLLDTAMVGLDDKWARATLIMFRGSMYENDGDVEGMRADTETAYELFEELGERWGLASTLASLATLHSMDGKIDEAIEEFNRAVRYLSEFGASSDEAFMHLRLANLYLRRNDLPAARREAESVRTAEIQAGSRSQRLMADSMEATIARAAGDSDAMAFYRLSLAEQLEDMRDLHPMNGHMRAMTLGILAVLEVDLGDIEAARSDLALSYSVGLGTRDMPIMASVAGAVAYFAAAVDRFEEAATVLGASVALRGAEDATDIDVAALMKKLRAELAGRFEDCYAAGRGLTQEAALAAVDPSPL
ncbi:MAG: transcriptional regulator, winged helix family [Pseudonocardiales bacterium]|nr:transcriptional regulator, winged helix family [Pseudonocardiales bacterium]